MTRMTYYNTDADCFAIQCWYYEVTSSSWLIYHYSPIALHKLSCAVDTVLVALFEKCSGGMHVNMCRGQESMIHASIVTLIPGLVATSLRYPGQECPIFCIGATPPISPLPVWLNATFQLELCSKILTCFQTPVKHQHLASATRSALTRSHLPGQGCQT